MYVWVTSWLMLGAFSFLCCCLILCIFCFTVPMWRNGFWLFPIISKFWWPNGKSCHFETWAAEQFILALASLLLSNLKTHQVKKPSRDLPSVGQISMCFGWFFFPPGLWEICLFSDSFFVFLLFWVFSSSKWLPMFWIDPSVLHFFEVLYSIYIVLVTGGSISINTQITV